MGSIALILLLTGIGLPPLLSWQRAETERANSMSNLRRLANGLLLYVQDWDGRAMPPAERLANGSWRTWPQTLRGYVTPATVFNNPANPVTPFSGSLRHPVDGYPIDSAYALNRRVWGVFGPGPVPLDNLELPEKTVLFVEAGPMWRSPRQAPRTAADRADFAVLDYGDTTDRIRGFCPYPSTHNDRMAVVGMDGHAVTLPIDHYGPADGPHDRLYGRLGGSLYNWNGGHPNGETDRPPRE